MPIPRTPAPGPLDVALSLVLHRALPFSPPGRHAALRDRLGWGPERPAPRRLVATRLGLSPQRVAMLEQHVLEVLAATGPPPSVLRALDVFAARAPCDSATAALALYEARVTGEIIHPAGVLIAARAAGASSAVELVPLFGRTGLVPVRNAPRRAALAALAARRLAVIGAVRLDRLLAETGSGWTARTDNPVI